MTKRSVRRKFENHPTIPFGEWDMEGAISEEPGNDKADDIPTFSSEPLRELDDPEPLPGAKDPSDQLLYYLSMGSGSSGNCCFLGSRRAGILIDAGVKADKVEEYLKANGIPMSRVKAILLTHDHTDHVKYAYTLVRTHKHIRVFCTNRVISGILRRTSISKRIREYHNAIFKEIPFRIGDFEITAFEVPHDSSDSMGFSVEFDGRHFVLATDLGEVQTRARHYISQADYLVMEANYDLDMLRFGRYPAHLKARIQTSAGHMDNNATAAFLAEIINPRLRYIFLCHLSQDNNTPVKAFSAVRTALENAGVRVGTAEESLVDRQADVQLSVLPRFDATRLFVFRPERYDAGKA